MTKKVGINGVPGRMAQRIAACLPDDMELVCALARSGSAKLGKALRELPGFADLGAEAGALRVSDRIDVALDVLIDFSGPAAALERAEHCAAEGIAMLCGTTGFDAAGLAQLEACAARTPILLAANTSLGVNLLEGVIRDIAKALPQGYDIEVVESHHRWKKDAPSGTALFLARAAAEATGRRLPEVARHGREGIVGARSDDEIGMHALRMGDVVGEHRVYFCGNGERIEIAHSAHSRDTFARGAIEAARWLSGQEPGHYSMRDMLFGE